MHDEVCKFEVVLAVRILSACVQSLENSNTVPVLPLNKGMILLPDRMGGWQACGRLWTNISVCSNTLPEESDVCITFIM